MKVLAVDPGKMTGWASFDTDKPKDVKFGEAEFMDFEALLWHWAATMFELGERVTVVIERFTINSNTAKLRTKGDVYWSIETIGVARLACHMFGHHSLVEQGRDAKKFGSDRKLRTMGWWTEGSDHARDAARHLIKYLADSYPHVLDQLIPHVVE